MFLFANHSQHKHHNQIAEGIRFEHVPFCMELNPGRRPRPQVYRFPEKCIDRIHY